MTFHDAGTLSTEEKEIVIETIKEIKEAEKAAAERGSGGGSSAPPPNPMAKRYSSTGKPAGKQ